ncbi:hypothetical protein NIES2111_58990 (plasmid) [Nostoc sp. NIES-2111]|nr:hypothetical protein NIES2111_58990 [Nostoc sp. NIES-2111]
MTYIAHRQQPVSEQTLAQAELQQHINQQAQVVAPELLTSREIDFYEHELYIGERLVARIVYDDADFVTERWIVMVNNAEVFRRSWWQKCFDDTQWHYSRGKLPVQEPETPAATTGNEIMAQIADECEKHGLELLDDGVYRGDVKLGEAGCTDGNWWFVRVGESQERVPCDSEMDAVYWLSMVDAVEALDYEQLLDLPFDMLTAHDWQRLLEYGQYSDLVAA